MRLLILFIFFFNISVSQKIEPIISDIPPQLQLIKNFPKSVKNQTDFLAAINAIEKFNPTLLNTYSFIKEVNAILNPLRETIAWAENKASIKEQMLSYKIYFLINESLLYYSEKITTGNTILLHQDLLQDKEINRLITSINYGYIKLDAYNEVIKLIPLRKKYAHLNVIINTNAAIEYDLAIALYKTKNYKRAIFSFLKRKTYYQKQTDALYVASMSNNVGLCYYKLQDFPKALDYFNTAIQELKDAKENDDKKAGYNAFFKSVILSNIANIDVENKNYNKAIVAYNNLVQKTKIAGEKENIPEGYLNLAKVYFLQNKIKLANIYLDSTANNYFNALSAEKRIDYNNCKAKIELLNGNIETATKLFNLSKKINDSSLIEQAKRESILAETKYNFEEKDKALQLIKNNLEAKEQIGFYQKIGLFITSILLITIAILLYKNSKRRKLINQQNIVLKENLKEKEILLKEVHHRVKNNLQIVNGLLELQVSKSNSDEVKQILQDSERQINSISLVHQMLYKFDEFSVISVDNYINELVNEIKSTYPHHNITNNIQVEKMFLKPDTAISLGLIISELITNSYKHAFINNKGNINISLNKMANNQMVFNYQDDGIGFKEKTTNKETKTMGFTLLKMLAEEINGEIEINGENGLQANIKFKLNEN